MVTEATIPKGYKQTEVGVIPEDWDVEPLERCGEVVMGQSPPGSTYNKNGGGIALINGPTEFTDKCPVRIQWTTDPRRFCQKGDLLICVRGSSTGRTNYADDIYSIGRGVAAIRANKNNDTAYLSNQIIIAVSRILAASTGSTFPSVDGDTFRNLAMPLPPTKDEQTAIAEALSDADELIDSLDKLIAKKRNLKQAAMQQLLTGKTRLSGFTGEWEEKTLGDHVEFLRNGTNSRAELTIDDPVKYLHYGDIHACNNVRLCPDDLPSLSSSKAKTLDRLCDGDLIFADASEDLDGVGKSVEITGVLDTECVSGLHTIAARFDKDVLADGFKGYLQFCPEFISQLRRLAAGTKVYATNRSHIAGIEMHLPDTTEQTAIAEVLSDMDSDIEALEERRDKAQLLKQGMMQQLLTGRIRLV